MTYAHQAVSATRTHVPTPPMPPERGGIQQAIARASAKTGVDFSYLMAKANVESSMNPDARAKNSSATGLYQFIETTWLQMVRDYGHKYGLDDYADCIDNNCHVKNAKMRQAILDLRHDPETSACMAAEYAAQNADILKSRIGDDAEIGKTELYLAHFLGAGGATKFLTAMEKNPDARAAVLFPSEAHRNPGVFYNSDTGSARTLTQIYDHFAARFNDTGTEDGDFAMNIRPASNLSSGRRALASTSTPVLLLKDTNEPCDEPATAANENDADPWVEGTPVAVLPAEFVEALLATPPRAFGVAHGQHAETTARNNDKKSSVSNAIAQAQDILTDMQNTTRAMTSTSLHQAALLVLAQNFAHEDSRRYNG